MFACFEMVSDNQFYNAVRSYNYRTRLLNGVNDLEKRIFDYMRDKNLSEIAINGYYIYITDGRISIMESPIPNINQLHFEFGNIANGNHTAHN